MYNHLTGTRKTPAIFSAATVALLLTMALSGAQGQTGSDEEAFVSWVREASVHLDISDGGEVNLTDLSFLDEALEGKRIVYLGVSDHWLHQKYGYRLALIRYLFEKGWRHIGMEMGYSDGKRVDRYLETGDRGHLGRVALYGYKGDSRSDRDDRPTGFPGMENPRFKKAFVDEEHRFLGQLRALNESLPTDQTRLRWFGFDVDLFAGGGYTDIRHLLHRHRSRPVIREILRRVEHIDGESRIQESRRLRDLLQFVTDNYTSVKGILGSADAGELSRSLQSLSDSYLFCEAAKDGPRTMKWLSGLIEREKAMIRLMDDLLGELSPTDKIILMGHNLHLSKDSENILVGPVGTPAPTLWRSVGTHLDQKMPGEIYTVWMTYDHGWHGSVLLAEGIEQVSSDPVRIEHLLAKAGSSFFLLLDSGDPREAYMRQERNFLQNGATASGILTTQADALFFVAEVTAPTAHSGAPGGR